MKDQSEVVLNPEVIDRGKYEFLPHRDRGDRAREPDRLGNASPAGVVVTGRRSVDHHPRSSDRGGRILAWSLARKDGRNSGRAVSLGVWSQAGQELRVPAA